MTGRTYTEREFTEWLEATGRTPMPGYIDDLLARTAHTRQRPAWLSPERWLPVNLTLHAPTVVGRQVPLRMIAAVALVILALIAGTILVVGSQRRVPAPFGLASNGLIAYVAPSGDTRSAGGYTITVPHGDIKVVDPVTGVTRVLVGGLALDGAPVFSRDGTRVAFVRDVSGGQSLYVVDAAGGEPRLLTKEPMPTIRDAEWSPDGGSVAFTSMDGAMSRLWIARADGSGATRVPLDANVSVALPQWRPPTGGEILLVGSTVPGFPAGSGNQDLWGGSEVATGRAIGLYVVRPDGSGLHPITATDGTDFDYSHAAWTPDGTRIVTQRSDPVAFGNLRVRILAADGTELDVIEPTSGVETMDGRVSPDGLRIAYADMSTNEMFRIRVVSIDGTASPVETAAEFLGGAATFRWSPNGHTIIVTHQFHKMTWLYPADGGPGRQLTWTDPGYSSWQRLAP